MGLKKCGLFHPSTHVYDLITEKITASWKQHLKIPLGLCVRSISVSVFLLYVGKTSDRIEWHDVGGQDTPCLGALFKVICTPLNKHTHSCTRTFLLQEGVAIGVERRSSVPPNHNASLRLSGSLRTYSERWWITSPHTHSLWLIRESWQELLQVIWHKAIIFIQSCVTCRTFIKIFSQRSTENAKWRNPEHP